MLFHASSGTGEKEGRLLRYNAVPAAPAEASSDWTQEWMKQHGRTSVPQKLRAEALSTGEGQLSHLGGVTRIKESTIDGVGNVLGGAGRFVFKGQFIKGAAQAGQGVLDILDIIPSAGADGIRMITGPDHPRGPSPYNYNISRGLGTWKQIEKPQHAIAAITDTAHAAVFKLGSDALKAIRREG